MAFWNRKKDKGYKDIKGPTMRYAGHNNRSPDWNSKEVLASYETSPWIYAALFRIASDIALTRWTVLDISPGPKAGMLKQKRLWKSGFSYKENFQKIVFRNASNKIDSSDVKEVDHPILNIIDKPNPVQNGWEFMYALVCHLELDGNAFIHIIRDASKNPMHLYAIVPDRILVTPTKDDAYYYTNLGQGHLKKIPESEIVWIRRPKPSDPLGRGTGTVKSLAHEIDLDKEVIDHTLSYFRNSARPDLLIGLGETALKEDVDAAASEWESANSGSKKAHGVHFYGGSIDVKEIGSSVKDLMITELRNHTRNTMIQSLGLPPEQLGIIENSNRSTIDSATYLYTMRVTMPRISQIWYAIQYELMPQFLDQKASLVFSYESPVPEDKDFILKVGQAVPETRTINEWRDLQNLAPVPGGDEMYSPTTYSNGDNEGSHDKKDPEDGKKNDKPKDSDE